MRRTVKALVAVVTCLSVHTHALQDLQLPHIELPQVQKRAEISSTACMLH